MLTSVGWSWDESKVPGGKLRGSVCVLNEQMWSKLSGKASYLEQYINEWKEAKTKQPIIANGWWTDENSYVRLDRNMHIVNILCIWINWVSTVHIWQYPSTSVSGYVNSQHTYSLFVRGKKIKRPTGRLVQAAFPPPVCVPHTWDYFILITWGNTWWHTHFTSLWSHSRIQPHAHKGRKWNDSGNNHLVFGAGAESNWRYDYGFWSAGTRCSVNSTQSDCLTDLI